MEEKRRIDTSLARAKLGIDEETTKAIFVFVGGEGRRKRGGAEHGSRDTKRLGERVRNGEISEEGGVREPRVMRRRSRKGILAEEL